MATPFFRLGVLALPALLAGCATVDIDRAIADTNAAAPGFTQGALELGRTAQQREQRSQRAADLLAQPLSMDAAVQLALVNSAQLQALLAQEWSNMASANQAGRMHNPVFSIERVRAGPELEIGRFLSMGLLDLLTLPQRQTLARSQQAQAAVQMSASVVQQVGQVRQAWVRAVAAQQSLTYAQQVQQAAHASAELARRMQATGNFTRLQRARQHAFYADATAQLATAQHAVTAAREELVRLLGLDDAQAARLQLPARLPDPPARPRDPAQVRAAAMEQRMDVQLARLQLDAAGKAQGLSLLSLLADTELGVRRDSVFDGATRERPRGVELEIRLPLFDWGGATRAGMNAQMLAAANRYEAVTRSATSQLRERYSAYVTAWELARHYREEIVPLRQAMAEENVLRYNGMLIGVFELLADTREQIGSVLGAISAQQQFWLAQAALDSELIGQPLSAGPLSSSPSSAAASAGGH